MVYISNLYKFLSSMDKFNPAAINKLISFDKAEQISKMTPEEKITFKNDVKKHAAYFMLTVSRSVETKDYKTAKSILIFIADSCSCIEDPDSEVRYLIQVCCQHLAFIRQMETAAKQKNQMQAKSEVIKSQKSHKPIYVFKYNKFSGQFQCDEQNRQGINQNVLFYISKLNAILINYQNTQKLNSIMAMLKTYFPFFLMTVILIAVVFIIVFSNILQSNFGLSSNSFYSQIPIIVCCLLFIIPLLKIYTKKPQKKDSHFFQIKLGEQISKINLLCAERGQKIRFFMPQGTEINAEVNQTPSSVGFIVQ